MSNKNLIDPIIEFLKSNPNILNHNLKQPAIRLVFSDYKKKYSQIHRIEVCDKEHVQTKQYFWVKIAINQSKEDAGKKITKEYKIQKELFHYFNKKNSESVIFLSTSKAVAVLLEFNTVISRECSGIFFNTYLVKQFPVFNKKKILQHCKNMGLWLNEFHDFYKVQEDDSSSIKPYISRFKKKYKKDPLPEYSFLTYCHNDYSPRNVFIAENRVEVIDFVGMEKGLPQEDIEFFVNYILKARFNGLYYKGIKQQMVESFYLGYGILKII